MKARLGWSDASFNDFLRVLGDLLPKENKVPANTYYARNLVSPLTIGVERSTHVEIIVFYIRVISIKT